ncbi:MAG: hypothetical protein AMXMBFR84_00560 [Candidatus Hydrogenedentota bacterium]
MKRAVLAVLFCLVAIAALAFTMADIQLGAVEAQSSTEFTRASNFNEDLSDRGDIHRIFMHVDKQTPLASAFAWELRQALQSEGNFTVIQLGSPPGPDDFPVLLARIPQADTFWTPFYCGGSARIEAKYASFTSKISLEDRAGIVFDGNPELGRLPIRTTMDVTTKISATGLLSLPAYRRIVTREAARAMAEYLRTSIDEITQEAADSVRKGDNPAVVRSGQTTPP